MNFFKKTLISITKPAPHVIVISNSEDEVEIRLQLVVEEQPQPILASRPVEEEKLQQHFVEGQPQQVPVS